MKNNYEIINKERKAGGFRCLKCHMWVPFNDYIGTHNRNHCFVCLWSKHVDLNVSGDRLSDCHGGMEPLALTFKHAGYRQGELMVVHSCCTCQQVSINRIAGDDLEEEIIKIFEKSIQSDQNVKQDLQLINIEILNEGNRNEVYTQLYGK